MAVEVIMPQMGESIFEGTIIKWLKKPGDRIERDEPLFEISTDKVDAEIPSPAAGVLRGIKVAEGQTVPIKTVVAVIEAAVIDAAGSVETPTAAPAVATSSTAQERRPRQKRRASATSRKPPPKATGAHPQFAAGAGVARENKVDLSQLQGSGAGGRISKQDVLAAAASGSARAGQARLPCCA